MTTTDTIERFRTKILAWAEGNLREYPWRKTTEPYEVLVAEILLQKTSADKVEPIYRELLSAYPTPASLADAHLDDIAEIIYSLGFQNQRSKALVSIAEQIRESGVPDDAEEMLELPYVGRYAANATLCFAFGEPRPIIDANVVRVYNRIFDEEFDYRDDEVWSFAAVVLPVDEAQRFNLAILDFAALVCQPKVPNCEECFFTGDCTYYRSNRT